MIKGTSDKFEHTVVSVGTVSRQAKIEPVDHFVQYHNVNERGPLDTNEHPVFVTTAKRWPNLVGKRVWLISGEGTPKSCALCGSFVVKEVTTPVPGSKEQGLRRP